jgi:twinkle protein
MSDGSWTPTRGEVRALVKRGIDEATCAKWRYEVGEYNGRKVQIANYTSGGRIVAQKLRFAPGPDGKKEFVFLGNTKEAGLYGQDLWRDGGKMVVVVEGEIDALTVSQVQNNKWPVVSVPNGAQGAAKAIRASIDWLEKFETVVLMFDSDKPGQEAAEACAPLFTPGKCKIARLPMKDPNEMLLAGRAAEILDAMWGAKEYRPDGIVSVVDVVDRALEEPKPGDPWCFAKMNEKTYGRRPGELFAFGAGTGVGKTDLFTQQIAFDLDVLKKRVGVLYLEQPIADTVRRIAGKTVGRILHVPGECDPAERERAVRALGKRPLFMFDSFGAMDWETVKARIRYMVVGLECEHVYLDHLTALVAQEEDERKTLDRIMAELAGQAQELGHKLHFISHLATPEGKPHEEGGRVMIRHFRGARSIGFWSHFMFGLERNQQAEDPAERSITTLRCLKDRVTGRGTGETWSLRYSQETGLLTEESETSPFENAGPAAGGREEF